MTILILEKSSLTLATGRYYTFTNLVAAERYGRHIRYVKWGIHPEHGLSAIHPIEEE